MSSPATPGYGRERQEYREYKVGRDDAGLTARQREVLVLIIQGKTPNEMCDLLDVSKQRMSVLVRQLVDLGLVVRTGRGKPPRVRAGVSGPDA